MSHPLFEWTHWDDQRIEQAGKAGRAPRAGKRDTIAGAGPTARKKAGEFPEAYLRILLTGGFPPCSKRAPTTFYGALRARIAKGRRACMRFNSHAQMSVVWDFSSRTLFSTLCATATLAYVALLLRRGG